MHLLSIQQELLGMREQGSLLAAAPPPLVFRAECPVTSRALSAALERLAARHLALRARLTGSGAAPRLQDVPFRSDDVLTELSVRTPDPLPFATSLVLTPPVTSGVLWRVVLLRGPGVDHVIVTLDRLIADSWSLHVLAHEFLQLYEFERRGRPANLTATPAQLDDLLAAELRATVAEDAGDERKHWEQELAGRRPLCEETQRLSRAVPPLAGVTEIPLMAVSGRQVLALTAESLRVTPFTVVLAAFGRALRAANVPREEDGRVLVVVEVANRDDHVLDHCIGPAVALRPLLLPPPCPPDIVPSGSEIGNIRSALVDLLSYSRLPAAELGPEYGQTMSELAASPLLVEFDTPNEPEPIDGGALRLLSDLRLQCLRPPRADLHLRLSQRGSDLELLLMHNPHAVEEGWAQALARSIACILHAASPSVAR